MNEIAHRYLMKALASNPSPSTDTPPRPTRLPSRTTVITALFGLCSAGLYALLYSFGQDLVTLAMDTHNGHKSLFYVPILVAFVFSLAHGNFTGRFWDALGIQAKK